MEDNGNVLAFGCHPDDIEFMCAGTLSLLKKKGYSIHMATVCGGEMGSTSLSKEKIREVRLNECENSAAVLRASYRWAGWEDIEVEFCHELRVRVAKVIREVNPFLVLTLPPVDYMVDHEETSKLVRNACFCASMPNFDTEGVPPTKGVPYLYYWDAVESKDYLGRRTPVGFYVDVTSEMEIKERMLSCHRSQRDWLLAQHGIDQYVEHMKEWDRQRGKHAGVEFAESFCQHLAHPFPQDNILKSLIENAVKPVGVATSCRMEVVLKYEWVPVQSSPGVPYRFPEKISPYLRRNWKRPAIYRWVVFEQEPGDLRTLYIGETELLHRRIYHYLNPGPSQQTNQRLKAEFERELSNGRKVTLEMLSFDAFDVEGIRISMTDLSDKMVRRFLQNLFAMYQSKAGYTVLNA